MENDAIKLENSSNAVPSGHMTGDDHGSAVGTFFDVTDRRHHDDDVKLSTINTTVVMSSKNDAVTTSFKTDAVAVMAFNKTDDVIKPDAALSSSKTDAVAEASFNKTDDAVVVTSIKMDVDDVTRGDDVTAMLSNPTSGDVIAPSSSRRPPEEMTSSLLFCDFDDHPTSSTDFDDASPLTVNDVSEVKPTAFAAMSTPTLPPVRRFSLIAARIQNLYGVSNRQSLTATTTQPAVVGDNEGSGGDVNLRMKDCLDAIAAGQERSPSESVAVESAVKVGRYDGSKCRVCADEATGMYFGALVCVPCKASIRRHDDDDVI